MRKHVIQIVAGSLLFAATFLPLRRGANAQSSQRILVVVVSASTGLTDISSALLRRTFQGFPTEFGSGKRLLPLNHPVKTPDRTRFDRAVLGLTQDEIGRYWIDQKIRGVAEPPRTLGTAEFALRVVASFPGAITYADSSLVRSNLAALTIDGKHPSDPGYLLAQTPAQRGESRSSKQTVRVSLFGWFLGPFTKARPTS